MERYFIWYSLQLKAYSRRKVCWIQTVCVIFVILLFANISLPDTKNVSVGLCNIKDEKSKQLVELLEEQDSAFTFLRYEDEALLQQEVLAGKLECGILFSEDFDERLKLGELKNTITYIATPFSTKGSVVRETVYAALFRIYSSRVLLQSVDEVFKQPEEKQKEELLERNIQYTESDEVFQIEIQRVDSTTVGKKAEKDSIYPIQGLFGLMLFLIMWLAYGRRFERSECNVAYGLIQKERAVYEYLGLLASATIPAFAGSLLILGLPEARGGIKELFLVILLLLYSGFWIMLFGRLVRSSTGFLSWILVLILLNLLLCPVCVDMSKYFPIVKYIGYIMPLRWYLRL